MPLMSAGIMLAANAASSAYAARKAEDAAEAQMAFQAQQSATSWQRGVADMRAAGINPMLAASKGGASTPSGAMPSQFFDASKGLSSALEATRTKAEISLMKAQEYNTMMDTSKKDKERTYYHMIGQQAEHGIEQAKWSARSAKSEYDVKKAEGDLSKDLGEYRPGTRLFLDILRGVRK